MTLLARASLRYLARHPWQLGLSVLGIALGVAVVVSVDLANQSAARAFELSAESVAGRATHQVVGGPSGVPEQVYPRLVLETGVMAAAPVVEAYVQVPLPQPGTPGPAAPAASSAAPKRTLHLLGIDPFAEQPFRRFLGEHLGVRAGGVDLRAFLTQPGGVLVAATTAAELGLQAGDRFELRAEGRWRQVRLLGVLEPADEASRRALADLLVADLATAQELLDRAGWLSHVDLRLPAGEEGEAMLARVQAVLPESCEVLAATSRQQTTASMTRAFRFNLRALSLLALVCGGLLVYNTMSFSVIQRRPLIGLLRAIGVSRRQVLRAVLVEAAALGAAGSALGLLLGVVLGRGLVHLVTRTINDLYFVVQVRQLELSLPVLLQGLALGIGATLLAALAPAREAASAPPRQVLTRSDLEGRLRGALPRSTLGGGLLCLAGAGLIALPEGGLPGSFGGLLLVILGCALLTPVATVGLMRLLRPLMGRAFGLLGRMAAGGVEASLSRTAVAIAALTVAVSVTVAIGVMVGSFRAGVVRWLQQSLAADVYLSPAATGRGPHGTPLDDELAQRVAAVPGVAYLHSLRVVELESAAGNTRLVALGADPRNPRRFDLFAFRGVDPQAAWRAFEEQGAVFISEPYAYRHGLRAGDFVTLRTDAGEHRFAVAGVYTDYGYERGTVTVSYATYQRLWHDRGYSALAVFAAPGTDVGALATTLRQLAPPELDLVATSHRALLDYSLQVFDRTFVITAVLRLVAGAVAFIGVLSALMALQLERARELGVLRANGLTPRQVWQLVTCQTGLMGLAAGLFSLPVGLVLAWVMVHVVNRRSFGWTLELQVSPAILLQALGLALVAAVLAGLYPSYRMARTSPAAALRGE